MRQQEPIVEDVQSFAQSIVDTVREPLLILDGALRVRSANTAFYQTFQVSPEETEDRLIYRLGNGQWDIPALRTLLEDIVPKSSVFNDFELEHDFPLIGRKVMLLNARKLRPGNHTEFLVLAIEDITSRREAERVTAEIDGYAQNIVDTVREPLLMLDTALRVKSANRAFYQTFKVSPDETEGQLIYQLGDGQWDIPALRTLLDDIIPQHAVFNDYEVEYDFPSIGRRVMLLNARKLRAGYDTQLLVLSLEDVTEQRRIHDLEVRFTSELRESYRRLQELERLRDDLTHMIIHDLRTPLTSIITGMQTLGVIGELNAEQREMMNIAISGGEMLLGMINDLLDVEKLESGAMALDYTALRATDLVESAVAQVEALAVDKQLTLRRQIAPEVPPFSGDASKLRRTLVNLIGNAIKFTPPGGVIQVSLRRAGDSVVLAVSDSGEGIAPEFLPYVFDRFRQGDASTTRSHGGLGLGLAIARSIVEMHGGTIRAASGGKGHGATFTVDLPLIGTAVGVRA